MSEKEHLALLETFWRDLYAKNFEKVGAYFTEDGRYEDVCTPDPGEVSVLEVVSVHVFENGKPQAVAGLLPGETG